MNYLILGGNGYLGSKLIHQLSNGDNKIVFTRRLNSDLSRVSDLTDNPNLKSIVASADSVETAMEYDDFDIVINMACSYGRKSMLYSNVLEANIEFPLRVLNLSVKKGIRRFVTIGTGLPDELNMYSFSKKMFSEFGCYYSKYHNIDFLNLKLEMFYGYDEPRNRFIPCLIKKMINGEKVDVTLGTQVRDIIYVGDIINAIIMVINSDLKGYKEISVGTGVAPSVSELVDYIWNKTGRKSVVNKGGFEMRYNEPDCVADLTVLKSICDWNPVYWKEGIGKMIERMENEKNENIN